MSATSLFNWGSGTQFTQSRLAAEPAHLSTGVQTSFVILALLSPFAALIPAAVIAFIGAIPLVVSGDQTVTSNSLGDQLVLYTWSGISFAAVLGFCQRFALRRIGLTGRRLSRLNVLVCIPAVWPMAAAASIHWTTYRPGVIIVWGSLVGVAIGSSLWLSLRSELPCAWTLPLISGAFFLLAAPFAVVSGYWTAGLVVIGLFDAIVLAIVIVLLRTRVARPLAGSSRRTLSRLTVAAYAVVCLSFAVGLAQGRAFNQWVGYAAEFDILDPAVVPGLPEIAELSVEHQAARVMALGTDGLVWEWGTGQATPRRVTGVDGIVKIATGEDATLALDRNGDVWLWGCLDSFTGLCPGKPTIIEAPDQVVGLAVGWAFAAMLTSDGRVWAIGHVTAVDIENPCGRGGSRSIDEGPYLIPGMASVVAIDADQRVLGAATADGDVRMWNSGRQAPPSRPIETDPPDTGDVDVMELQCAMGDARSYWQGEECGAFFMTSAGTLAVPPYMESIVVPTGSTQVLGRGDIGLAVTADGEVIGAGSVASGLIGGGGHDICRLRVSDIQQCNFPCAREWRPVGVRARVTQIALGYGAAFALDDQGQVWSWGTLRFEALGRSAPA